MKKVVLFAFAILVSLSLLACGGQKTEEAVEETTMEAPAQVDTAAVADTTAPAAPVQ
jgi:hypothetical protein